MLSLPRSAHVATQQRVLPSEFNNSIASGNVGVEQLYDILRKELPDYMSYVDSLYTFHSDPALPSHQHAKSPRDYSNPLSLGLPNAPGLTIACMYGVGLETERGYQYITNPDPIQRVKIPFIINTSFSDPGANIINGVRFTDGDETVPLVSLGYMCTEGWRNPKLGLNPHKVKTVVREYRDPKKTMITPLLRPSTSVNHVDIMGNTAVIADLVRLVTRISNEDVIKLAQTPGGCTVETQNTSCWNLPYPKQSSPIDSYSSQPQDLSKGQGTIDSRVILHDKLESCIQQIVNRVNLL